MKFSLLWKNFENMFFFGLLLRLFINSFFFIIIVLLLLLSLLLLLLFINSFKDSRNLFVLFENFLFLNVLNIFLNFWKFLSLLKNFINWFELSLFFLVFVVFCLGLRRRYSGLFFFVFSFCFFNIRKFNKFCLKFLKLFLLMKLYFSGLSLGEEVMFWKLSLKIFDCRKFLVVLMRLDRFSLLVFLRNGMNNFLLFFIFYIVEDDY